MKGITIQRDDSVCKKRREALKKIKGGIDSFRALYTPRDELCIYLKEHSPLIDLKKDKSIVNERTFTLEIPKGIYQARLWKIKFEVHSHKLKLSDIEDSPIFRLVSSISKKVNDGNVYIPNDDVVRRIKESYDSLAIFLLASEFYVRGICAHFVNVYTFATCTKIKKTPKSINVRIKRYTFTSLIRHNIHKRLLKASKDSFTSYIGQCLFAICTLNKNGIVHGNLTVDTIRYRKISDTDTFMGVNVLDKKYWGYNLNGKHIYVISKRKIIQIASFEGSSKFHYPRINYTEGKDLKSYDLLSFIKSVYTLIRDNGDISRKRYITLRKIIAMCTPRDKSILDMDTLKITAEKLLLSDIFDHSYKDAVVMGTL